MDSSELIKVEKLQKTEDYPLWKFEIRVLLKAADIMDVVTGEFVKPERDEDQSAELHEAALVKWNKSDCKAQRIIVTALGRQPKLHVLNCETARDMWSKLESVYEKKSEASVHLISQKFFDSKKDPADDIAMFISKLLALVQQLKELGENISNKFIITKILIPPEYHQNTVIFLVRGNQLRQDFRRLII